MTKRCGHFNGRASMSRCERECLPLMAVCVEHATPDAIVMAMRQLVQERDVALAKVDRLERENDALRDELATATRRLADHESGDALAECVAAMELWGSWEDGIPEAGTDEHGRVGAAYDRACQLLGQARRPFADPEPERVATLRAVAEEARDKALRFDLDAAGIASREAEAFELVVLRARVAELETQVDRYKRVLRAATGGRVGAP